MKAAALINSALLVYLFLNENEESTLVIYYLK